MTTYRPTPDVIAWMKRHVASLKIDGIWGYEDKPIVFKRTAEKTMALIRAPFGDHDVDEQIERNQVVMAAAGITFVDLRGTNAEIEDHAPDIQEPGTGKSEGRE